MSICSLPDTVAHPFSLVNTKFNTQLPLFPKLMIAQKKRGPYIRGNLNIVRKKMASFGLSSKSGRALSPQCLLKHFNHIDHALEHLLGLTTTERRVVMEMLRLWAYYGQVYPSAAFISKECGCSEATYWRAIRLLRDGGFISIINRFLTPFRRQISNLYRLDKLILLLARYLAEHGSEFIAKWLQPYLAMCGRDFWQSIYTCGAIKIPPSG